MPRSADSSGFTLLEVLVAIAILGIGLTMILSSQVGLFNGAARAQHLTVASNLVRCKMSEVELDLLKRGFSLTDEKDEGDCCGEEGEPGYDCAWKVETVELPNPDTSLDGGTSEGDGGMFGSLEALTALTSPSANKAGSPPSLQDIQQNIGTASAAAGIGPLVMGMVYPSLKPMLEASIRKITVSVYWREGINKRDLTVTQFVTDPQKAAIDPNTGLPVSLLGDAGLGALMGGSGLGTGTTGGPSLGAKK